LEALQGLSQGRAADLHALGQVGLRESVSGQQVKYEDELLDLGIGPLGQRAGGQVSGRSDRHEVHEDSI
jgi:hypothetical protein